MREDDPLVCHCLAVAESEVRAAIRAGADSVQSVGRYCEAGTGCQSCHAPIRMLLREQAQESLARGRAPKSLRQLSLFEELVDDRGRRPASAPMGGHRRS